MHYPIVAILVIQVAKENEIYDGNRLLSKEVEGEPEVVVEKPSFERRN